MMNLATASHHNRLSALRFIMIQLSLPLLNLDGDDPPVSDVMVGGGHLKYCSICKTRKHPAEFNKDRSRPDGLSYYCRECRKASRLKKEGIRAERRMLAESSEARCNRCGIIKPFSEYRSDTRNIGGIEHTCKACNRGKYDRENAVKRARWAENRCDIRDKVKARRKKNIEATRAYGRRYNNSDKGRANVERYRVSKVGVARFSPENRILTSDQWKAIRIKWDRSCAYCGRKPRVLHRDHVVPVAKGGILEADNVVPACRSCNASKGAKDAKEWMEYKGLDYERFQLKLQQQREEIF